MEIRGLDLSTVAADAVLESALETAVRQAVAFYAGHGLSVDRVAVSDLPERGAVLAEFVPFCDQQIDEVQAALNFTALGLAVARNLDAVDVFKDSGPFHVRISEGDSFEAGCHFEAAESMLKHRRAARLAARADASEAAGAQALAESCETLTVSGAVGGSGQMINGEYQRQEAELNDKLLFRKRSQPEVWMAFIQGRWYVTDTKRKDENTGGGWLYSVDSSGETPGEVQQWSEWDGQRWATDAPVRAVCEEKAPRRLSAAAAAFLAPRAGQDVFT